MGTSSISFDSRKIHNHSQHMNSTSRSIGLSATSQQYFSLRTNQPPATSQQYSSLRTNQHQPLATSQPNKLQVRRQIKKI
jgi:hypothetical protein